jgi:sugar phosphate isomerase/epimerase
MATNASARGDLRAWRAQTPPAYFADVRAKFEDARLTIHACNLAYDDSFTDEEIDTTLRQAAALGVTVVASPLTMSMAKRLAPFAERHHVAIAIRNQTSGTNGNAMSARHLAAALALSPAFRLKLDLGNLTASNDDAVAVIREHQTRVSHVLVTDRLRNGGASQLFGEGDTPIVAGLKALKASSPAIPVFVEYDYVGLRTPEEEVRASLDYVRRAIQ